MNDIIEYSILKNLFSEYDRLYIISIFIFYTFLNIVLRMLLFTSFNIQKNKKI